MQTIYRWVLALYSCRAWLYVSFRNLKTPQRLSKTFLQWHLLLWLGSLCSRRSLSVSGSYIIYRKLTFLFFLSPNYRWFIYSPLSGWKTDHLLCSEFYYSVQKISYRGQSSIISRGLISVGSSNATPKIKSCFIIYCSMYFRCLDLLC